LSTVYGRAIDGLTKEEVLAEVAATVAAEEAAEEAAQAARDEMHQQQEAAANEPHSGPEMPNSKSLTFSL
jgi:cell pole-organizing protein PopZ